MEEIESIKKIKIGEVEHPIDAITLGGHTANEFQSSNLVDEINENSTDEQYPSAKCMWDIYGVIRNELEKI